jgi:aminopeptidase N
MDEGFNTFITSLEREAWFDESTPRRGAAGWMASWMRDDGLVPVETPPDRMPARLLGRLAYAKAAGGLVLLRDVILGAERFDYAFRVYIERWAFKSPRPADFFRTIEDAAGMDLAWFWRGWFLENAWLDQAVAELNASKDGEPASVTFENRGELVMPLDYRVTWSDGEVQDFHLPVEVWADTDRIVEDLPTGKSVRAVEIDPEARLPDVDRENNRLDS